MTLNEFLKENEGKITSEWIGQVLATYPLESHSSLSKVSDPFANPLGTNIKTDISSMTRWLLSNSPPERVFKALDNLCRIRSVQEFTASQATGFVFLVKKIVRELLVDKLSEPEIFISLLAFESRVDQLSLLMFDVFTKCKEDAFTVRRNEVNTRMAMYEKAINHINHGLDAQKDPGNPQSGEKRQGGGTA